MKITATAETALTLSGAGEGLELASEGPLLSPYHFLAASLASCIYLVIEGWAGRGGHDITPLAIDVAWEHDDESTVIRMTVILRWPGLPEDHRQTVQRLAGACSIHRTLHRGTEIAVELAGGSQ